MPAARGIILVLLLSYAIFTYAGTPDTSYAAGSGKTDTTASAPVKKSLFRKVVDYFANSNKEKEYKKFDFSIIGGPHYSEDTKFGLGLVAAGLYRMDPADSLITPSNVSIYGDISTSGFYLLGVRGNNIFPRDKYRLNYNLYFFSFPSEFWGIGYENGRNDANSSEYKRMQYQVKTEFLIRAAKDFYVGPNVSFDYVEGKDFDRQELIEGMERLTVSTGIGAVMVYDSRDVITAPYKGIYARLEQKFFPAFMNKYDFIRTDIQFDWYKKVWKKGVVAIDYHSQMNYGDVPWTMMANMGGSYRMRGYYEGRYRDRNLVEAQIELRQHVWRRNSVVVWAGAGNVFRDFDSFEFSQTLPNFGIGYRWEFKKRVNVRLDYGFGKGQHGFIFNINEAF